MGTYFRCAALVLAAVVLVISVSRSAREQAVLLSVAVCVTVSIAAVGFLEPVLELVRELRRLGDLGGEAVSVLLRSALIGVISQIAQSVCEDAGEAAMGKTLQLLSNAVILWLSLPLLRQILTMIEGVLTQN